MPLNDDPEIFGLNENANIKFQEQESDRIIETILSIQPRTAAVGGGLTPDQMVLEKSSELQKDLPEQLVKADGLKDLFI